MPKGTKKGASKPASGNNKKRVWQAVLAVLVLGAMIYPFVSKNRDTPSTASGDLPADPNASDQPMRDHLVLPATPRKPRPVTLDPASFTDPEVREAYQAAKETPEAIENMACYCGCFGSAGHRNNLDCFHDDHGKT
jgi:uncharacterized protein with PCYCGC motif